MEPVKLILRAFYIEGEGDIYGLFPLEEITRYPKNHRQGCTITRKNTIPIDTLRYQGRDGLLMELSDDYYHELRSVLIKYKDKTIDNTEALLNFKNPNIAGYVYKAYLNQEPLEVYEARKRTN